MPLESLSNNKKIFLKIYFFVCLLSHTSFSDTDLFKHLSLNFNASMIKPTQRLGDLLQPSPNFGVKLKSGYYSNIKCHVMLDYSLLTTSEKSTYQRDIHYIHAGLGAGYQPGSLFLPEIGLGVDISLIRSAEGYTGKSLLMDDNESEYGVYPFLNWDIYFKEQWFININFLWSVIFSQPNYGHLPKAGIGIGKRLW